MVNLGIWKAGKHPIAATADTCREEEWWQGCWLLAARWRRSRASALSLHPAPAAASGLRDAGLSVSPRGRGGKLKEGSRTRRVCPCKLSVLWPCRFDRYYHHAHQRSRVRCSVQSPSRHAHTVGARVGCVIAGIAWWRIPGCERVLVSFSRS
jgi:hypothetical protein